MQKTEREKKTKRIKDIASRLSDEALERLLVTAEAECAEDDDCQSGNPGPGEPPPDPPDEP